MSYRKDLFKIGDLVVWDKEQIRHSSWMIEKYGTGPFIISRIYDRPEEKPDPNESYWGNAQSNWESMGHTQHVEIIDQDDTTLTMDSGQFSGAWFRKVRNITDHTNNIYRASQVNYKTYEIPGLVEGMEARRQYEVDAFSLALSQMWCLLTNEQKVEYDKMRSTGGWNDYDVKYE